MEEKIVNEIVEVGENINPSGNSDLAVILATFGAGMIVGNFANKYIVKPIRTKITTKLKSRMDKKFIKTMEQIHTI